MAKIGDRVKTQHGKGEIVGKDLPNSRFWRWVVRIDVPFAMYTSFIGRFSRAELCYFSREVQALGKEEDGGKIQATRYNGIVMDDEELQGYNITGEDVGSFAVIQHGVACLGIGATRHHALAVAKAMLGEDVREDIFPDSDGEIEVVKIEQA